MAVGSSSKEPARVVVLLVVIAAIVWTVECTRVRTPSLALSAGEVMTC